MRSLPAVMSAAGSLLTGMVIGAVFTLATPSAATLSADGEVSWEAEITKCVGPNPTPEMLKSEAAHQCFESMMNRAVDLRQMDTLQEILSVKVQEIPYFFSLCHTVGHKVGQYAYRTIGDAAQLLRDNKSTACEYGYGHGIIDGLADDNPTVEEFSAAANVCADYLEGTLQPQSVGGYCADGTGHAAWWSTFDLDKAMDLCASHRLAEGKAVCVGGVVMEMYEPVGFLDTKNVYPLEEAPERLPEVCSTIAERGDTDLTYGCGRGSGYIFTRPAWKAADGAYGDAEAALRVAEVWKDNIKSCELFALPELKSACLDGVIVQMPIPILSGPPEALKSACEPLSGKHKQECMELRLELD